MQRALIPICIFILIGVTAYWYYGSRTKQAPEAGNLAPPIPGAQVFPQSAQKPLPAASNWKTYRNEKYGFSLQYPQNWNYSDENNRVRFSSQNFADIKDTDAPTLNIDILNKNTDTRAFVTANLTDTDPLKDCADAWVADISVLFCKSRLAGAGEYYILFNKGSSFYEISDYMNNDDSVKIISTLKFAN